MAERKRLEIITCAEILSEINRVAGYEKIRKILRRSGRDVPSLMGIVLRLSSIVDVKSTVRVIAEDPTDNILLACAQEAGVDFIVSGDRHLLQLGQYGKIKIVTASRLLDIVR
jgi:putative PIN family toxin of toxin-antitoxin system